MASGNYRGVSIVAGKYYVVDLFSGPVCGPFNSYIDAEETRRGLNTAEDCEVSECVVIDAYAGKYRIGGVRVKAASHSCETCGADCDEPTIVCDGCAEGNEN